MSPSCVLEPLLPLRISLNARAGPVFNECAVWVVRALDDAACPFGAFNGGGQIGVATHGKVAEDNLGHILRVGGAQGDSTRGIAAVRLEGNP